MSAFVQLSFELIISKYFRNVGKIKQLKNSERNYLVLKILLKLVNLKYKFSLIS